MASYDLEGAMNAGVPLKEIADFLASKKNYDAQAARQAGVDDWDIIQELNKPTPGLVETFTGGVKRSIGELGILATDTIPALAASAVLSEEDARPYVERQFKEAEEARAELERKYPTQYKSYKDVEDARSAIGYVFERTGELIPDIVPTLVSGGVGYHVGKKAALTAAEKAAAELAERTAVKAGEKATKEALEPGAMSSELMGLADEVGQKAARDVSKKFMDRSAKVIQEKGISGAQYGTYFGSLAQNVPEVFESVYEETGELAPAGALLFGGLSSFLDTMLPNQILDNLGTYGKSRLVAKMLEDSKAAPAVWKSILKEGAKAAGKEGLTESAQEGINVLAEQTYGSNKEFFDQRNIDRYLESFFAGVAGGGVLGSISGVTRGLREKAAAREEGALKTLGAEALGVEQGLDPEFATQLKGAQSVNIAPGGGGTGEGPSAPSGPQPGAGATTTTTSEQPGLADSTETSAGLDAGEGTVDAAVKPGEEVIGFKTAKGSMYAVDEQGKTSRTKKSAGRGQGETYAPHSVLYVSEEDSQNILSDKQAGALEQGGASVQLGYIENNSFKPVADISEMPDGVEPVVAVVNRNRNEVTSVYKAQRKPQVGLSPVEKLYNEDGTSNTHIGNPIVELQTRSIATESETIEGGPAATESETIEGGPAAAEAAVETAKPSKTMAEQIAEQQSKFLETDPEAIELAALDSEIKGLRSDLRTLREQNAKLLKPPYTTPEAVLERIKKGELKIDPAPFEQEAALTNQVNNLEQNFSTRQDKLFARGRQQGFFMLPTETGGTPTELTETGEAVSTGPTRRFVLKEDGTYGPQEAEVAGPQYSFAIDKDTKRMVLVDEKGQSVKLSSKQQSDGLKAIDEIYKPLAAAYNQGVGKKEKLPGSFRSLPPDMRQAFLRALFVGFRPETAFKQLVEYRQAFMSLEKGELESEKFFKDVKKDQERRQKEFTEQYGDIYDLTYKAPPRKSLAEQQKKERVQLIESEEKSRRRAVEEARVERSLEQQPVGKGQEVDQSVIEALLAGDVAGALKALADTARDLKTMKGSDRVVRTLAKALSGLNLKTKVVFGSGLAADRLAEYDPVTDTIHVGKNVVLDEATLLHELTHAATVKVLNAYENFALTGEKGDLTDAQIEAAEHLMKLMEVARKRVTLDQYKNAFENIYEFVAYAMTDPRFQAELAKHNVRSIAKYTKDGQKQDLWTAITTAIERLVNFFSSKFNPTGNVALEVSEAFQEILAAPDKPINLPTLPAKQASLGKKEQSAEQLEKQLSERLEEKKPGIAEYRRAIEKTFTNSGVTNFIRKMQNERIWVKKFQDYLDKTGQLISSIPDKFNNLYTQITLSSGRAKNIFQRYFYRDFHAANQLLADMAKTYGMSVEKMLARLHVYAIALHSPERRRVKFLREAPLTDATAIERRQEIFDVLSSNKEISREQALALREELDGLVDQYVDKSVPSGDPNNDKYNTLAHTANEEKLYRQQYDKDMQNPAKAALVDKYFKTLDRIKTQTVERNRQANYFSPQVGNFVNFYDFKNYFSFKGKPDAQASDFQVDPMSRALSGENQDKAYAFEGRLSESDNPMLNTLNEGARAALREGRVGVTTALSNLAKNPKFKDIAEVVKTVSFAERYEAGKDLFKDIPTQNTVFHYKPDGSIDVIQIADKEIREGVRRPFREDHPLLDLANKATSFFGQMHTRYNPAFAPVDFTRNLLTYAGIVAAEYGPAKGANVIAQMASIIGEGGMQKTAKFSLAFARGDVETMDRLAKEDPDFYGELARYFELGGRVSYVQALSYRDNLLEAVQNAKRGAILRNKDQIDGFFDAWLDMFEMTTRMAAFRTIKKELIAEGKSPEDAEVEAIAFAKNLANFEQVGEWGKTMGAFFMFFRPAATGAVRAIQSIAPAFDFRKDEDVLKSIKEQTKFGGATEEEALRALAAYNKQRKNARVAAVTIVGMGATVFTMAMMMAGDDEEERNKVLTDDPARWVRNARFNTGINIGGQDLVVQIPWGFGNGALASAGAQIAFAAYGGQGFLSMANNIMDATFESFLPLPVSKINKFEHPTAWAVDSVTPSVLRPLFEFTMNMDGLGREIYNNRQSRYADAYTGGDNIPLIFKDVAGYMFETTGADASPNALYFFANNYLDGVSRVASTVWGLGNVMIGRKDFDPRTDTFFLDAYLKSPSNYDSRMFAKAEERIKEMEKNYKSFEGTAGFAQYISSNPMDKGVVDFYNSYVNGTLRDLRAAANQIRRNQTMSPAEKKDQLRLIIEQQNRVKSAFTTALAGFDESFGDLVYKR